MIWIRLIKDSKYEHAAGRHVRASKEEPKKEEKKEEKVEEVKTEPIKPNRFFFMTE